MHCHVDASPSRTEQMDLDTLERCLDLLKSCDTCKNLDISGGAPELHPHFEYLVNEACEMGKHVIVRHNLTVAMDCCSCGVKDGKGLLSFFAGKRVEVLASLPYCEKRFTDEIRGEGVFDKSIEVLKHLNYLGYGQASSGLILNLICNRDGAISAQDRALLESSFRHELYDKYGIIFNRLLAVTNMPINRYLLVLKRLGSFEKYMNGLVSSFDPASIPDLVCRYLVSVGYDGRLYDCDFNQMLGMTVDTRRPMTVFNFDLPALMERQIRLGPHCFGCTAGGGSS